MTAAVIASVILAALAVLQAAVAAGMPWGRLVWGGRHRVLPTRLRVGSALSIALYGLFAAVLWGRASAAAGPASDAPAFFTVAAWVLFAYFGIGIAMNAISRSAPERAVMTPACVLLAACALVVATA